ncbi:MAG: hypothetical protein ACTHLW_07020, partial [Verrucomicrobiota bacterium]
GKPECFIIMPIGDPDGYSKGHFQHVHEDLVAPACNMAGYTPVRADEVKQTNLIHLDVLQKLIDSPMAICDLSSRNPNVLFELGLRQAFDKPVVLIQEIGTPKIFDIAPLRYTEYRKERVYHEVLEDQKSISQAICATRDAKKESINSIVKLLSITKPATLPEVAETNKDPALQVIRAELSELRLELRQFAGSSRRPSERDRMEFEQLRDMFRELEFRLAKSESKKEAEMVLLRAEDLMRSMMSRPDLTVREAHEMQYLRDKYHQMTKELRSRNEKVLPDGAKG